MSKEKLDELWHKIGDQREQGTGQSNSFSGIGVINVFNGSGLFMV
ncbi:hypothetical protein [Paenibacillus wynnii]|nr:hypothetical protein [Paenibacillus wynnii]MDQ0191750.1 hypothetical protein [Paenibacillus wynnii]